MRFGAAGGGRGAAVRRILGPVATKKCLWLSGVYAGVISQRRCDTEVWYTGVIAKEFLHRSCYTGAVTQELLYIIQESISQEVTLGDLLAKLLLLRFF